MPAHLDVADASAVAWSSLRKRVSFSLDPRVGLLEVFSLAGNALVEAERAAATFWRARSMGPFRYFAMENRNGICV